MFPARRMERMGSEMTKIQNYVENVFAGLPKTREAMEMKLGMIDSMEERYDALLAEGKSENEAFGAVISGFGSMEELRQALGAAEEPPAAAGRASWQEELYREEKAFQEEYRRFRGRFNLAVTGGVALCILGLCAAAALDFWASEMIAGVVFLLFVAPAVCLFVYFGLRASDYERQQKQWKKRIKLGGAIPDSPGHPIREEAEAKQAGGAGRIAEALSGVIILLAIAVFLLLGLCKGLWHPGWVVFPVGVLLCGIIELVAGIWKKR